MVKTLLKHKTFTHKTKIQKAEIPIMATVDQENGLFDVSISIGHKEAFISGIDCSLDEVLENQDLIDGVAEVLLEYYQQNKLQSDFGECEEEASDLISTVIGMCNF